MDRCIKEFGCVAVRRGKGWRGVFYSGDGSPHILGFQLHEYLKDKDLNLFAKNLMLYDDWVDYLNNGVCEYCGGIGLGRPRIQNKAIGGIVVAQGDYPDPERRYHSHEYAGLARLMVRANILSRNEAQMANEVGWVYVVDTEKRTIEVFVTTKGSGRHKVSMPGGRWKMVENYQWLPIAVVEVDDNSDWPALKEKGLKERMRYQSLW